MKKILITLIGLVSVNLLHSQTFPSPGFTLPAGKSIVITYEVEVNDDACPEGLVPVMNISNQATVSGSNFSNVLTDDPDIGGASDPTLTPFAGLAIGNLVFDDVNRNGMFDMSDVGIPGVVLNLYRDVNSNNMLDAMDGAPIGMTTTGMMPAGAYSFAVCPGTYIVEIAASNFSMGGALYNGGSPFLSSPIGGALDPDDDTTDGDDNGDPVVGFGVASAAFTVSTDRNDVDFAFKTPTTVTINDVTMVEGTGGGPTSFNFSVERSDNVEAFSLTVNTMEGTATVADLDYTAISGGTVMFTAGGNLEEMVTVLVNHDNKVEAAETFTVVLSNPPVGVTIIDGTGLGTISNDDNATVTLTGTASQDEGTTFTFTATLDNPVQGGFMVAYTTSDGTALVSDNDYNDNDGSLTFDGTAGEMETIMVSTIDDAKVELDEDFTVALGMISLAPAGVSIGGMSQTGTIENNDQAIVTISNVSLDEGDMDMTAFDFTVTLDKEVDAAVGLNFTTMDGTATLADMDYATLVFTIQMSNPSDANVSINYATMDGTATTAANDYSPASGSHTFLPGEQTKVVNVNILGDCEIEPDETFLLRLSELVNNGRNVSFSGGGATLDGTGTIINDDALPVITCLGNVTQTVPCNTTSKVISLPVPSTSSVCGTGTLEFRYRTVNSMNTPTGVYSAFAPSGSASLSFSLGRYEIEWRITDGSGMSSCSYYLQVNEMTINTPVIQGPTIICPSLSGLPYSVTLQAGVTSYQWSYSGSGVTIHNNGSAEVSLDFAEGATAGTLTVTVVHPCGGPNAVGDMNITLGNVLTCAYVNCLLSNLFVTDDTFVLGNPQVFKIGGQITSNATIQSPKTIVFKAGEGITLLPDFQVNPGSIFIAEIEDCPVIFPFVSGN